MYMCIDWPVVFFVDLVAVAVVVVIVVAAFVILPWPCAKSREKDFVKFYRQQSLDVFFVHLLPSIAFGRASNAGENFPRNYSSFIFHKFMHIEIKINCLNAFVKLLNFVSGENFSTVKNILIIIIPFPNF